MSTAEHVHEDPTARTQARPLVGVVALVNGASSGIGAATGALLARAGADVALVARREDRLAEVANELADTNMRLTCVTADVSDEQAAGDAVDQTIDQLGRLDIVVANAGVSRNTELQPLPALLCSETEGTTSRQRAPTGYTVALIPVPRSCSWRDRKAAVNMGVS